MLQRSPSAQFIAYLEKYSTAIFFSCVAKPSEATIWRLLVYLLLGPCCFLACSHFILLEWPSSGACRLLAHLHIGRGTVSLPPGNPECSVSKRKHEFSNIAPEGARRPLDQVFAKVWKSSNEVACLTFSSLILFHTKIPLSTSTRGKKCGKIWIAVGFLFSKARPLVMPGLWHAGAAHE